MSRIVLHQLGNSRVEALGETLTQNGHQVCVCLAGEYSWPDEGMDLILVDASGGQDGTERCCASAELYPDTPLILLAATENPLDSHCRVLTYNNVILFPFTLENVTERVKTLLAQRQWPMLQVGDVVLDVKTRCVWRGDAAHELTPKQARLLQIFMCYPERTLSRKFLMETTWNTDYIGDTRTLDVHVRWIRERIEDDPAKPQYLRTVRGVGYRFGIPPGDGQKT